MCGQMTPLTRDFHRLLKNIQTLTNNQVQVQDYDDDISQFILEIKPNDGYYKKGTFEFEVKLINYPDQAPSVTCRTQIYHPNIEDIECYSEPNVCLSLFDDWTSVNDLEDCVQGLLFLLYNPNLNDPFNPYFDPEDFEQHDKFADDVRRSLQGEIVEGLQYSRNIADEENLDRTPVESTNLEERKEKDSTSTAQDADEVDIPEIKEGDANADDVQKSFKGEETENRNILDEEYQDETPAGNTNSEDGESGKKPETTSTVQDADLSVTEVKEKNGNEEQLNTNCNMSLYDKYEANGKITAKTLITH